MAELSPKNLPIDYQSALAEIDSIQRITLLRQRPQHAVYRVHARAGSFVLKCFSSDTTPKELRVYALLQKYAIPTLPCHKITNRAILLEDLDSSETWRQASEVDMALASTGYAVAEWYRQLHNIGFELVTHSKIEISFLHLWFDEISPSALETTGQKLEIANEPAWQLVMGNFEALKAHLRTFPITFNYNDFAAENLALSSGSPLRAIVFDYDQFCLGTVYSDWRNVSYSLKGQAKEAFAEVYGPVSKNERRLDDVLSIIESLIVATQREKFPRWALPSLQSVSNGDLARKIHIALENSR